MSNVSRVTWVFPIVTLLVVAFLLLAGRSSLPPQLVYKYLQEKYPSLEYQPGAVVGRPQELRNQPGRAWPSGPNFSSIDTGMSIVFAQVADGVVFGTKRFLQTTLILANGSSEQNGGKIEFYDDAGNPLSMTIDGVTQSTFPFALGPREVRRFITSGEGDLKVGWAHVHSDQPVNGTSAFGIRDPAGTVFTEVGVSESTPGTRFTLFADMVGASRTGMAIANPSDTAPAELQFELFDPSGLSVGTAARNLAPRNHFSLYVDELFPTFQGVDEFEGALVVISDQEICAVTLRTTGDQWTSMPVVKPPPENAAWTKLAFAHVGDGSREGLKLTTTIILMNNTSEPTEGSVDFFSSDGTPMTLMAGGTTGSSFNFSLAPGGVVRLLSDGVGELKEGWAVASMDQPIAGTGLFSIFDQAGLATEVGVGTGPLKMHFYMVADSIGSFNTGFGLVNPLPSEFGAQTNIIFKLHHKSGYVERSAQLNLGPFEHQALFMTELFPDVASIHEYEGLIEVSSSQYIAPICLRQAGVKLTSMPTLPVQFSFNPASTIEFAQNIAGTSPGLECIIHQREKSFAFDRLRISSPDLGLDSSSLRDGERIGYGFFSGDAVSRVFELVVREKGSLKFEYHQLGGEESRVAGQGTMEGSPNGDLEVELTFFDKRAYSYIDSDFDMHFFFPPGLIIPPEQPGSARVTTEFRSVSIKSDEDVQLNRRFMQDLHFTDQHSSRANLLSLLPVFPQPGGLVTLRGNNFGDAPEVIFNYETFDIQTGLTGETTLTVVPIASESGEVEVVVPGPPLGPEVIGFPQLRSIQVSNGQGAGNPYLCRSLFAPAFQLQIEDPTAEQESSFSIVFELPQDQFALNQFDIDFYGVSCDLSQLVPASAVGSAEIGYDPCEMVVASSAENQAVLDLVVPGTEISAGTLTFDLESSRADLQISLTWAEPNENPYLMYQAQRTHFDFSEVFLELPAEGRSVLALARFLSSPTEGYPDSALLCRAVTEIEVD